MHGARGAGQGSAEHSVTETSSELFRRLTLSSHFEHSGGSAASSSSYFERSGSSGASPSTHFEFSGGIGVGPTNHIPSALAALGQARSPVSCARTQNHERETSKMAQSSKRRPEVSENSHSYFKMDCFLVTTLQHQSCDKSPVPGSNFVKVCILNMTLALIHVGDVVLVVVGLILRHPLPC